MFESEEEYQSTVTETYECNRFKDQMPEPRREILYSRNVEGRVINFITL